MNEYQKAVKTKVDKRIKDLHRQMELVAGISGTHRINHWDVDDWLLDPDITEQEMELYPNAKKAAELKRTKLYKALK